VYRLKVLVILLVFASLVDCEQKQADATAEDPEVSGYSKTPVFLVHGHGMTAQSWDTLKSYLIGAGYPGIYLRAIQLVPNDGPNIEAAENQIDPAVEEFLSDVNAYLAANQPSTPAKEKVDIIAHSMGVLSSRWYAAKVRPERVRTWISLAGANHGSDSLCSAVGQDGGGADDLCPSFAANAAESLVQFAMNGLPHFPDVDETPFGIGNDPAGGASIRPEGNKAIFFVTLRTIDDRWIIPDESALLDGAGGVTIDIPQDVPASETSPGNVRMENGVDHDSMLRDEATMKLVKTILEIIVPSP
jgi:pimeloyl-ACP methyl ester carboxylesterase